jgi:hypothetical protein
LAFDVAGCIFANACIVFCGRAQRSERFIS